jgi:hypothetical protein
MTDDTLMTTATDLNAEVLELREAWEEYTKAIEAERQVVATIIQELIDALTFLLQEADAASIVDAFCYCAPGTGERWVSQTRALLRAIDSLRKSVPQYATTPTSQEPQP